MFCELLKGQSKLYKHKYGQASLLVNRCRTFMNNFRHAV